MKFFWVVIEAVATHHILLLGSANSTPFVIVEHYIVLGNNNLGAVIKEDASGVVT